MKRLSNNVGFYELSRQERSELVLNIYHGLLHDLQQGTYNKTIQYCSDHDTYIRKSAYLSVGKICKEQPSFLEAMLSRLNDLLHYEDFRIRQTVINAAGEIGKIAFEPIAGFMDKGLIDAHHSVRNAVIGSIKKMGEVNPVPVLKWAQNWLNHEDKEIRREICHGIELRGRKHPEDILPLLKQLQFDKTARVRNTLVHVLGQIAYKKGCLEIVVADLKTWENQDLVKLALEEIIDVHDRYKNFSTKTQAEARVYIERFF
jgi:HEAT repeat protein